MRKYSRYEENDDSTVSEDESLSDELPADKYYSLNNKKAKAKTEKIVKKPSVKSVKAKSVKKVLKAPPKPKVTIDYTEVNNGQYEHNFKNMDGKDEDIYNLACSNIDNIQKHQENLFKERHTLMSKNGSKAELNKNAKLISSCESDLLQLNKLCRYYDGLIKMIESKYE